MRLREPRTSPIPMGGAGRNGCPKPTVNLDTRTFAFCWYFRILATSSVSCHTQYLQSGASLSRQLLARAALTPKEKREGNETILYPSIVGPVGFGHSGSRHF